MRRSIRSLGDVLSFASRTRRTPVDLQWLVCQSWQCRQSAPVKQRATGRAHAMTEPLESRRLLAAQASFHGDPFAVGSAPVTIQGEDFDRGGQGVAYNDTSERNTGGHYRPDEGVDIMSHATGQFRIGGPYAGEWLEYTVNVAQSGSYELEFRVSQDAAGSTFHAEIDGTNVTGSLAAPNTGSFNIFTSVKKTVNLAAGQHVLRFAIDANASNGYGPGLDWIKVSRVTQPPPTVTKTIAITDATYVRGGAHANTNFGTASELVVKRHADASYTRETFLQFNLTDVAEITAATLRLYGGLSAASSAGVQVAVYAAGDDWTETGLTYDNRPTVGATLLASKTFTSATPSWHAFDLTNFLKAEKAAGRNLVSIVLKATSATTPMAVFNADGAISNRPELVVESSADSLAQQLDAAVVFAGQQLRGTVDGLPNDIYPVDASGDGQWNLANVNHWTVGFLPGALWQMYERTGDAFYRDQATSRTLPLAGQASKIDDLTFRVFNAFRPLYETTGSASHRQTLLDAAASKNTRWNETVGAFSTPWRRSDSGNPDANYGVLFDQSMDMELMFWAARESGNSIYRDRAVRHLRTVAEHMVRPDGGSYHWVYFNAQNGAFVSGETYQGYDDESTWARGQAWGIYSFVTAYRETGQTEFLVTARELADFFLARLPADRVPFWDFDDPAIPNAWRDSSAAAITASALIELGQLLRADGNAAAGDDYRDQASGILASLASNGYLAQGTANDGIILHGALNVPSNSGTDAALIFGDYYFLEAINRYAATAG